MENKRKKKPTSSLPLLPKNEEKLLSGGGSSGSSSGISTSFNSLLDLPIGFSDAQCIWFDNQELLICGGYDNSYCYSYHTIIEKYRLICHYPRHVASSLCGHVVLQCDILFNKQINNNNNNNKSKQIILLSFGGQESNEEKYTLIMNYQSVWDSNIDKDHKNEWITAPFNIGKEKDSMLYIQALIGGSKKHLLFILYPSHNIEVFNLESFRFITKATTPFEFYRSGCLVKIDSDDQKQNHWMILFNCDNCVLIKYDGKKKIFSYETLPVCPSLNNIYCYSYVYFMNYIMVFGGSNNYTSSSLDTIYVYSISNKEWKQSAYKLPISLESSFAILDPDHKWIHIVGGRKPRGASLQRHLKIRRMELLGPTTEQIEAMIEYWVLMGCKSKKGWIVEFNTIIINYI